MNQQLITTNQATILVVDLPEGYTPVGVDDFSMPQRASLVCVVREVNKDPRKGWIDLPPGEWELLGKTWELSEEQWKDILPQFGGRIFDHDQTDYPSYPDYAFEDHPFDSKFFDTATESGLSLLTERKVFFENPHKHPIYLGTMGADSYNEMLHLHEEAQQHVFKNAYTLIKR